MSKTKRPTTISAMLLIVTLTAALGFGIKALLLHPLYIRLASDIVYRDAFYTNILYYLIDEGLWDMAVFAICYPATAFAVWRTGLRSSSSIILSFSLITFCKFPINYLVSCLTHTGFPDGKEFLRDLPPILTLMVLELLQYALVIGMTVFFTRRYAQRVAKADVTLGQRDTSAPSPVFPFVRLVSFENPLQLTALGTALLLFISRELSYHVYELTLYVNFGSTDGWADMLLNLFADVSLGILVYFLALLCFGTWNKGDN